ncbi:MAG: argininosuccinate lyase [Planctomycetes bacterium]|nr:argininosuccinate lyase [Planctomycetota bacterium]
MSKTLWYQDKKALKSDLIGEFNNSLPVDCRLSIQDIDGSIAYAKALKDAGILSAKELKKILHGLKKLQKQFASAGALSKAGYEDVHTAVEVALGRLVGKNALKIHTGRSRNEQVVSDERLYLKQEIPALGQEIKKLQETILKTAPKYPGVIMPGYTHLQQAQPILFSFYLMSWFFMLQRDKERLSDCLKRVDVSPYGSGAIAGNSCGINRGKLAKNLGFSAVSENALDAVSDRDFIIECLADCAILMMHLSRFCEDLIIWSSTEFGFVRLADGLATSSSLMPQKHNPDSLELVRGKSGRVYGNLFNLLTVMKGLPFSYCKDMQEDKEPMFDSIKTVGQCLGIFALTVETMKIYPEKMEQSMGGFMLATDVADYLVKKGMPFREAHTVVSKLVHYAENNGKTLETLALSEFRKFSGLFGRDIYKTLDFNASVAAKNASGGTSLKMVNQQIKLAKTLIH